MSSRERRVCVIGAGAAGLAAARALRDAAVPFVVYEASDRVGGHWNHDYEALHLITAKTASHYAGHPMPEEFPLFPSRDQVRDYLDAFADAEDLRRHIEFGTRVTRLTPLGDAGIDGWSVETDLAHVEEFDSVIVANGHLWDPSVPELPGDFAGTVLHSSHYRNVRDIQGSRVLVVGAGNSGCDLAVDAAQARLQVSIVIRNGIVFQPKTYFGKARSAQFYASWPPVVQERITRFLLRVSVGSARDYPGLPDPETTNLFKTRPIINSQLLHWMHHGRVRVVPGIAEVDGSTVRFTDGSASDYDTILLATGFKASLPFLTEPVERAGGMPVRYAGGTLLPRHANLYVLGLVAPAGAQWPVYEEQMAVILDLMAAQRLHGAPIVERFQESEPALTELDMPRHLWNRRLARSRKRVRELLAGAQTPASSSARQKAGTPA